MGTEQQGGHEVLVVGDVMVDEYLHGIASRISPEAPVPIVELGETKRLPGGAMNAAAGVVALGVDAHLVSVVGDDADAASLEELAKEAGIRATLVRDPTRRSTVKSRVYAHGQQLLRIDRESVFAVTPRVARAVSDAATDLLRSVDVLLLSDYAKGVLTPAVCRAMIDGARHRDLPVVVDPKTEDFSTYRDATVITPNLGEARRAARASSSSNPVEVAHRLRPLVGSTAILLTLGAQGMMLFDGGDERHYPARGRAVYDVTGAGDTVAATVAAFLAKGLLLPDAVDLASRAAAIAVTRLGAARVSLVELIGEEGAGSPTGDQLTLE